MDESSATDDSEDDEEIEGIDGAEDDGGMAGSLGDVIRPSLLNRNSTEEKEEPIEIKDSADEAVEEEDR